MTGKAVLDAIQRPNGPPILLPMDNPNPGDLLVMGEGNQLGFEAPTPLPPEKTYPKREFDLFFDLNGSGTSLVDVLWSDFHESLTLEKIAFVKMQAMGISSDTASIQLYFKALAQEGVTKNTGYMGFTQSVKYASSSSRSDAVGHNSNDGSMRFPLYQSAAASGYAYGPGNLTFDALLHPHDDAAGRGVHMYLDGSYHQSAAYDSPNVEQVAWSSYDQNPGISGFDAGFRMYPSSGALDRGFFHATAVLKEAIDV
ncbi:hypothetical protein [Phaeobacter sp. JH209A]|uniref:hypothetical protein n=1 Tax=Phaeobacter sp. JH209A TaxID=3112505 RepID=UPI003A89C377